MAKAVVNGAILGVECASEQEPYILVKAVGERYQYQGADKYTWMGWLRAGDWLVDTVKFEKYGNTDSFWRSIITGYELIWVRQSGRNTGTPPPIRIEVASTEISELQERVLFDLNSSAKARDRPRRPRASENAVMSDSV
jgi:hypothetical protein